MKTHVRFIAMYLPQFYPIPENDETWGKGFTEWTNAAKAKPLFKGHYQPRIPADLGFYDLRVPETRELQAEMAKKYGVEGFMYWHYWFGNGKRLLDRPFDEVLKTGKPDFPFCLAWANHSWTTKTWTALGQFQRNKMIVEQKYPGKDDYINHFNTVLPAFKDPRYIKVDGKPLFFLYAPLDSPEIENFVKTWRELAKKNDITDIHFVGLCSSGTPEDFQRILDIGFDAVAPGYLWYAEEKCMGRKKKVFWNYLNKKLRLPTPVDKYEYKDIIKYLTTDFDYRENFYPSAIPQWDRSPRSGRQAVIYHGSTPDLFRDLMSNLYDKVKSKSPEHRIIFLRSWNEWGEGNYFEPDMRYGTKYLEVVKEFFDKQ